MRIFLVGFMCSGKTTLGRALAKRLDLPFIDLDDAVEARAGMRISEIFATQGEDAFRRLELETLRQVCAGEHAVIACGGGTPCRAEAWEAMRACEGTSVWLRPGLPRLVRRLLDGRAHRPLIANIDTPEEMTAFAQGLMDKRDAYYANADIEFDSSLLETPEEIEASVQKLIDTLTI